MQVINSTRPSDGWAACGGVTSWEADLASHGATRVLATYLESFLYFMIIKVVLQISFIYFFYNTYS